MSTKNLISAQEKVSNEDSIISSSTSISISTEPITQDITKGQNANLIEKNIEQRITEILSYLQSDSNLANNKIPILKYLQSLLLSVEFNSEILLRKTINEKDKLNLYKVIIQQYIFYTNAGNKKEEEENYRSELQNLFLLLLSQVVLEKDSYHYILSPLINFINRKNIINSNKKNSAGIPPSDSDSTINLKPEHLQRVLLLLRYFYGYYNNESSINYFFFSGDSDSSITISNKENNLDRNKKILNLDETLCIMMFIKVMKSEYIKAINPKINFKLFEMKFQEKKNSICINIDTDNQLTSPMCKDPLIKLDENEMNCVLIKLSANKKKTIINSELYVGITRVDLPPISMIELEKDKNAKNNCEIKEIALFKNFIGICSNIIIYKEKKNEGLPKFLLSDNERVRISLMKNDTNNNNNINETNRQSIHWNFPNGIYNEKLYSYFIQAELVEKQDNITGKLNINNNKGYYNNYIDFLNNNLISIYIPTRYMIPAQNEEKTIQNTSQLILVDSINGLNAEFNTRTPGLNGVHIFPNLYEDDLSILGGITHLLPILELMLEHNEFLNSENFYLFFELITIYVFSPKFQKALAKDKSNFFKNLSYFLERIPEKFFNDVLAENFKAILVFLCPPDEPNKNYKELCSQFHNYILINEKILLKFNENNQIKLMNQICTTISKCDFDIDIIKIIRIILHYDKNRKFKFCCKKHCDYFNQVYSVMEPELSKILEPIHKLLEKIFEKTYDKLMSQYENLNINNQTKNNKKNSCKNLITFSEMKFEERNNLYYLFYLLTYNISPCSQYMIIDLCIKFISSNSFNNFLSVFDSKNELFDILLFVFKTSIFDIKIRALELLLNIEKKNNWSHFANNNIKIFFQNEILPVFLLDEVGGDENNNLEIEKNENEINIEEEKDKNQTNNILERKQELNIYASYKYKKSDKYGIIHDIEIDREKYVLFSPTKMEKNICKLFYKKKYRYIAEEMFFKIFEFIYDNELILDLLIKIVSNGDLSLISNFLSNFKSILDSSDITKHAILYNEIINKDLFLQFILDINLQLYIINNNRDKNKIFNTSFPLDAYKNSNVSEDLETPLTEDEKKKMIKQCLKDCENILLFIFTQNIRKLDYLLSWGKYYEHLREENIIYDYIYDFINEIFLAILTTKKKTIITLTERSDLAKPEIQSTLYYFNIFFEFITFFKLKYNDSFFLMNKSETNKIIEENLKLILCNQESFNTENLTPFQETQKVDDKVKSFPFITVVSKILNPIWMGGDKKTFKTENEIYSKHINGCINKNTYINELEILFYNFGENFFGNNKNICNRGMNLITTLYHFFTILLNVGGEQQEISDNFKDFRLYLLLLIIAPPTINITESIKKKKWPNETQNLEMRKTIHYIIFDSIFFLYHKLNNLKMQEKEYNKKPEEEESKKNIECILKLRKLYMENLGFLLKILNKIYRGFKADEMSNKGFKLFNNKTKIIERIRNSGAFSFINEFYEECFIQKKINEPLKKNNINANDFIQLEFNINTPEKEKEIKKNDDNNNELILKKQESEKTIPNLKMEQLDKSDELIPNKTVVLENNNINKDNDNNNLAINLANNYLDDICTINFITGEMKDITLPYDNFKKLEKYINLFLEDENIKAYFENHLEQNTQYLYPFTATIETRQRKIKSMIPLFDNRKNIKNYPNDICLMPYYYRENKYKNELMKNIEKISRYLRDEIKLSKKILEMEEIRKEVDYRNEKKKLFKFKSIWSYDDFFYDTKKYKLKYKLLNHLTSDFTKIFLTPISDIDYYLPKFTQFKGDIFRNELGENSAYPISKLVDISFSKYNNKDKNKNDTNNTSENTKRKNSNDTNNGNNNNNNNNSMISFDSLNFSSLSNQENINNKINPIYELNQEYYSFLKDKELIEIKEQENSINSYDPYDLKLFQDFIEKNHLHNKGIYLQCEACLIKLPYHIKGIIFVNNEEIGFYSYDIKKTENDEDYDWDKKLCFGSIFHEQTEKYKDYFIKIPFTQIELLLKRRYYFKRNVLEVFTQNKKSYLFRIDETKSEIFFNDIISNNQKSKFNVDFENITIENNKSEDKIGLVNKTNLLFEYNNYRSLFFTKRFTKVTTIKNIYIKWINWEISTFTLINYLNLFSSRSYHDINQYPVFPWIITNYTNKEIPDLTLDNNPNNLNNNKYIPIIRPMGTPVGMFDFTEEAKERKDNYLMNFSNPDEKNPDENYDRYGSHYSTGLNLTYYLVRVFPYSYTRIEMQGKNFDDPNRLFNALDNSFECVISQKSDLRELIPEFFCFPEMFYNLNDLNLGEVFDEKIKQNKLVNDIILPPWANNDGYNFIKLHREMLESVEISEKIHDWFNIIFGSKQKGKKAKAINNLFNVQTYDEFDDKHKTSSIGEKIYQNRMVEFGVTPSQVFKNDADKRLNIKNLRKKPILFDFMTKKGKKQNMVFSLDTIDEIKLRESEINIEGEPYKIFSSWKKDEELKHEKMLLLYSDKVKIITRSEKSFFKNNKSKANRDKNNNKDKTKDKNKGNQDNININKDINNNLNNSKDNKEENEMEDLNKEIKEENSIDEDEIKIEDNSIIEDSDIKEEEISEITSSKDISKYNRALFCPKCRMDSALSPTIIYDKGNYVALGGFYNGLIVINKIEENEKSNKKNKNLKNINLIFTHKFSPISPVTIMKIDESESFIICANKMGCVFIFSINIENKLEWTFQKIFQDNQKEITSLDLNENLNIFITCDKEGYNNVYTFPQGKLFNSFKLNENQIHNKTLFTPIDNSNNSTSISRSESNTNISLTQGELYADIVIISHNPLPCYIFYIHSKKCLCVFSINFHFINAKYNIDVVPNGLKKYSDCFRKDYLFIYNKNAKDIEIYDIISLDVVLRSSKFDYTFVDFYFSKQMEHALIMVKSDDDKKENTNTNNKDKNMKKNYKILLMNAPGKEDGKTG